MARDALIKAVLLVSQEQHAYLGECFTADEGPLIAGGGNDTLDGGVGADRMEGGNHADLYVVDNVADVVYETSAGTAGFDTIQTTVDYVIADNVERLVGTVGGLRPTGNAGANILDESPSAGNNNVAFTDAVTTSNDTYR